MKKQKRSITDQMDLFAQPLPTFNIEGVQKVSSCVGFITSVLLYTFMLGYLVSRLVILFGSGNPVLSDYTIDKQYPLDTKVNLDEYDF